MASLGPTELPLTTSGWNDWKPVIHEALHEQRTWRELEEDHAVPKCGLEVPAIKPNIVQACPGYARKDSAVSPQSEGRGSSAAQLSCCSRLSVSPKASEKAALQQAAVRGHRCETEAEASKASLKRWPDRRRSSSAAIDASPQGHGRLHIGLQR